MDEKEAITNKGLLAKCLFVLGCVILAFIMAEHLHIANGTIAICGAAFLMMLYTFGENMMFATKKSLKFLIWLTGRLFSSLPVYS